MNTQTASSGSTSQKAQTSLRCRTPTSKGSGTNSTPAPAGFPDGRLTRLLRFTVEWAGNFKATDGVEIMDLIQAQRELSDKDLALTSASTKLFCTFQI